mmetsp:Transcript_3303/g.5352  ORF Transcript_3303/g.5352 Transcript_3303/m.5352 type:complete len:208 (+) Transcript_3303:1117-1740(+)
MRIRAASLSRAAMRSSVAASLLVQQVSSGSGSYAEASEPSVMAANLSLSLLSPKSMTSSSSMSFKPERIRRSRSCSNRQCSTYSPRVANPDGTSGVAIVRTGSRALATAKERVPFRYALLSVSSVLLRVKLRVSPRMADPTLNIFVFIFPAKVGCLTSLASSRSEILSELTRRRSELDRDAELPFPPCCQAWDLACTPSADMVSLAI